MYGVFEGECLAFADIAAENAHEGAVTAGVRSALPEVRDFAVGADHGEGITENVLDVLLADGVVDGLAAAGVLEFEQSLGSVLEVHFAAAVAGDLGEVPAGQFGVERAIGHDYVGGIAAATGV